MNRRLFFILSLFVFFLSPLALLAADTVYTPSSLPVGGPWNCYMKNGSIYYTIYDGAASTKPLGTGYPNYRVLKTSSTNISVTRVSNGSNFYAGPISGFSGFTFEMPAIPPPPPPAPSISGGVTVSSSAYSGFGWQTIPVPSKNITLTFNAIATTDLHVGFQYNNGTQYVEIVIGGWNNQQCAVRNYLNGSMISGSEWLSGYSTKVMPDTINPVSYTVVVAPAAGTSNGLLTITARTNTGVTSTIISHQEAYLNNTFTGYSFHAYGPSLVVGNYAVTSVPPPPPPPPSPTLIQSSVSGGASYYTSATVASGKYWIQTPNSNPATYMLGASVPSNIVPPTVANWTVTASATDGSVNITLQDSNGSSPISVPRNSTSTYWFIPVLPANAPVDTGSTAGTYESSSGGFGWKPITYSGNNLRLAFTAFAASDLCVSFKNSSNQYVEVVLGIAGNVETVIRTVSNNGATIDTRNEIKPGTGNSAIIPDVANPVNYTLSIIPEASTGMGIMTVVGTTKAGVTSTIASYRAAVFSQAFVGYSFKMLKGTLNVASDAVTLLSPPAGSNTSAAVVVGKYWMQQAGAQPASYLTGVGTFSPTKPSSPNITVTSVTPLSISYTINDTSCAGLLTSDKRYWFTPGPVDVAPAASVPISVPSATTFTAIAKPVASTNPNYYTAANVPAGKYWIQSPNSNPPSYMFGGFVPSSTTPPPAPNWTVITYPANGDTNIGVQDNNSSFYNYIARTNTSMYWFIPALQVAPPVVPTVTSTTYTSASLPAGIGTYCVQISGAGITTSYYGGSTGTLVSKPSVANCLVSKDASGIVIQELDNQANTKKIAPADYASTALVYTFYTARMFDATGAQTAINAFQVKLDLLKKFDFTGASALLAALQSKLSDSRATQLASNTIVSAALSAAQASYNALTAKLKVSSQVDLDALNAAFTDYVAADRSIAPLINEMLFVQRQTDASVSVVAPVIDDAVSSMRAAQAFYSTSLYGLAVPKF